MSGSEDSFWHGVGRGVGAAIGSLPGTFTRSSAHRSRKPKTAAETRSDPVRTVRRGRGVLGGAGGALLVSLLMKWARTHRSSPIALIRGAVAGAGAAGALLLYRVLLSPWEALGEGDDGQGLRSRSTGEVADELLAGAGRGLIYAALLAPYLPGPPLLRGAIAGTADYIVAPLGGLFSRLQAFSPIRKVPVISILLETGDAEDDPYPVFLIQGAIMGLIYGSDSDRP